MNLSPWHLIRILEKHGFVNKRSKGSHQIFYNSSTNKTVSVPVHQGRDLRKGTFLSILKHAGIDKNKIEL